jgi:hypothetical protein
MCHMATSVHYIQKPNVTMLSSVPAVKQGVEAVPEDELRVGTLGQDVQQICRSHKVEAGESHTLGLQVILQYQIVHNSASNSALALENILHVTLHLSLSARMPFDYA